MEMQQSDEPEQPSEPKVEEPEDEARGGKPSVLLKYIDKAREELDELHIAIEEFKDPVELARLAHVFTSLPQKPEEQLEFIQTRLMRASVNMNIARAAVENWATTRAVKRRKKHQQKKEKAKAQKQSVRFCDECGERADKESYMQSTPQWTVCERHAARCDFCDQVEDHLHPLVKHAESKLCSRCACTDKAETEK